MDSCSSPRTPNGPLRGLYSGVVLAGVGMGLVVGQGVASASPSDSAGASQSGDTSEAGPSTSDASADRDTDSPDKDRSPSSAESDEADAAVAAEADETEESDEADEVSNSGDTPDEEPVVAKSRQRSPAAGHDDGGEPTSAAESTDPESTHPEATDPEATDPESTDPEATNGEATDTPGVTSRAAAPGSSGKVALAAPDAPTSATTVRSLVTARPVTVENIVTDLLTWVGLRPTAGDAPAPETPVSTLVEALWLAVRQSQYTWNNQRPTADVTIAGPGPGGAVTGSLNAVDYDDTALTYTLVSAPSHGRANIDALGHFTYTPGAAAAGQADQFTIRIEDTAGNPFHVHGLLGLLGVGAPTEVTVVIGTSPAAHQGVSSTIDVDELVSRGGVEVTTDARGAVSVIEGRVTDQLVVNAADAAAVLNALAPIFGASANFADPSVITTSTAGTGDTAEHFYRFTETVGGITVVGSEVILVTDALGQVTSVFNYYRGVGEAFDVTPDASVDEDAEVRLIAATAYLGAGAQPGALESLLAQSIFTKNLVVYALGDDAAPSLAWHAIIRLPDTGDMSTPGATYLIHADGATAGEIILTLSNVQSAAAVTTATDWLGDPRTITIDTKTVFIFRTSEMVDGVRNISTYKTSYSLWGLGSPVLPGKIIKRSLFGGWDKAAVSAHANTALVYDYYQDVLGRTSYDGAGAPIVVSIKYNPRAGLSYANAFWDPLIKQFAFGDSGYLQAALDIVAHEYTHAVVTSVVGKGAPVFESGEQGALNEAMADILGLLIEGKADSGRWLIGEDSSLGVIRNLANPTSIKSGSLYYRDRYGDRYTGNSDDRGEHINSTIFGHAAYLMMTDAATSGITDQTWAKVFYHSLERLSASATFVDGRAAVLSSAQSQGLTPAQRAAIADAFDAVEIYGVAPSSAIAV